MYDECRSWWIRPAIFSWDAWYASGDTMKHLRDDGVQWLFGIKENRLVSETIHEHKHVSEIELPTEWKIVHLKDYWKVRVFCRCFKDDTPRYYATSVIDVDQETFERQHKEHWIIEMYHRAIKQLCHVTSCMIRRKQGQLNHFFCSLLAFSWLEIRVKKKEQENWYSFRRNLYTEVTRSFIKNWFSNEVNA